MVWCWEVVFHKKMIPLREDLRHLFSLRNIPVYPVDRTNMYPIAYLHIEVHRSVKNCLEHNDDDVETYKIFPRQQLIFSSKLYL